MKKLGARVPEIVAVSNIDEPLGDAYIMKFVEGESIARKILRDEEYSTALEAGIQKTYTWFLENINNFKEVKL